MIKKIIAVVIAVVLCVCFASCGQQNENEDNTLDIVCTMFVQYDWVQNIVSGAENVNILLLCDNGTDMHSYNPGAKDIIDICNSDVVINVGASDTWVKEAAQEYDNVTIIDMSEKLEEKGLLCTEDCALDNVSHEHTHTDNHSSADEHIWMSLKNADVLCKEITDVLMEKDPENAEIYRKNYEKYSEEIKELDKEYEKVSESSEKRVVVVPDRFPFVYLARDYNIECFAAFPGCSSDINTSFDVIIELAKKIDEYNLKYVAVTENSDRKTAKTVIGNTKNKDAEIVVIDSLQSVTKKDIEGGKNYLGVMRENLNAFRCLMRG